MRNQIKASSLLIAFSAAITLLAIAANEAAAQRTPLVIEVPSQPRMPDTTRPVLFKCDGIKDCNKQAAAFCKGFNYPNGRVPYLNLPPAPRPFPVYSVICFD
ncbi:MAG: hypothetical protein MRY74_14450 [Neomegalonema sp.]|nr:hypothetical protein [Neomegalonema sp.]